jgi:aryl-alcohol dehydrogenase-like predicted oxidoreductase
LEWDLLSSRLKTARSPQPVKPGSARPPERTGGDFSRGQNRLSASQGQPQRKTNQAPTSAEVLARSKSHSSGTRPVARTLPLRHCAAVRKTHQRHALSRQTDALSWLSPGPFCIIPPVELRSIGSLRVSVVGLGCNNFGMRIDDGASDRVVSTALDAGINFFDTADIYGATKSEEFLGRALARRRQQAIVASKFGMAVDEQRKGARPEYVRRACDDSLKRLGSDYIDLYQLHQPDPTVPIADTLGALNDLVKAGKVKEIGCSNFSAEQLDEAARATAPGAAGFVSVQNEYSLVHREPERTVLPACDRLGLAFLPYFPLASGLLTGKFERGKPAPSDSRLSLSWTSRFTTDSNVRIAEALKAFATARKHTLLELAMSWLASRPQVASVIAGATSPEQIRANAAAANWSLTREEIAEIDRLASL